MKIRFKLSQGRRVLLEVYGIGCFVGLLYLWVMQPCVETKLDFYLWIVPCFCFMLFPVLVMKIKQDLKVKNVDGDN